MTGDAQVVPLHVDCLVCAAAADKVTGTEATIAILIILRVGLPPEQLHSDLCFAHRRSVEDASRKVEASR